MYTTLFYEPIYNLLVFFLTIVPLHDIGTAIVLVTLTVKMLLLRINLSASQSQYAMKKIDKEIKAIREMYKGKADIIGRETMALYKKENIKPFSAIFAMIIQIPIVIALYSVFSKGIIANTDHLYSFISFPEILHTQAFGLFDVTKKNIIIGIITGMTAYILARRQTQNINIPEKKKDTTKKGQEPSFQESFQESLRVQMLYVFPIIILVTSAAFPAAIGLYWITSNIVSIAQDFYIKKKLKVVI